MIRERAMALGFDAVGVTHRFDPEHRQYFLDWIRAGRQGSMTWLARNMDKRLRPDRLFEETRSVIVVAVSYHHNEGTDREFRIARYARGEDYHRWMKRRIEQFARDIRNDLDAGFRWRSFVDTGPVLERDLAAKAGIGWIGKNSCVINEDLGSFIFLGVIFCNRLFEESAPALDQCGSCTLCIDSCPTGALTPYQLDARRCLAYHNIEKRGERERGFWQALGNHLVGCDICQEVCPFNQNAPATQQRDWLGGFGDFEIPDLKGLLSMTRSRFRKRFRKSAISRIKYEDFMRNVFLVIGNLEKRELLPDVKIWKEFNRDLDLAEWHACVAKLTANR